MEYRILGKTGLRVSRLCFGSLTFRQAQMSPDAALPVLESAYNLGVNFIDTAQLYDNYEHLRRFISLHSDDTVVTSKTYAYEKETAIAAVAEARQRLNRDYIDIFLLHEQESEHTLRGHAPALDALMTLKAQGIIKAVGLSTHHVAGVRAATAWGLDVVHPLINIDGFGIADGTRDDMLQAIAEAHDNGLGVYGMKALGGGNLFRKAAESLTFVKSLQTLDSIAIGMQCVEEVRANVYFFENNSFTAEQQCEIEHRSRHLHIESWCEGCSQCVTICKAGALSVADGKVQCTPSKCRLCGYCGAVCKNFCLKIV